MLDKEFLEETVHKVISAYVESEVSADEDELIHMEYDILSISEPVYLEGRRGAFYKVAFEYELKVVSSDHLEEDELIRYRQSLRLTEDGQMAGISEKVRLG